MNFHKVRVNTCQDMDTWLKSNIHPDQAAGWVHVVCPDKTAKDSSVVSELQTRGWKFDIEEWDCDSDDDPRAMCYGLNG